MKYHFHFINWLLIAASFTFFSCKDDETTVVPFTQQEMWDCHHESEWDQTKVKDQLIGQWAWKYISCYSAPEEGNSETYKTMEVAFYLDNKLAIFEDGVLRDSSTWEVRGGGDLFQLEVVPPVPQLYGTILFCDDWVEFHLSSLDICDNYFIKIE